MVDTTLWGTLLFVSVVSITPGPNNLLLAASGANFGFFKTLPHMCGVIVGFALMVVASGFGLGIIFTEFPQVILPMKIMSVSFLIYLSWRIASGGAHVFEGKSQPLSFLPAVLFQTINPKGISFLLSIMGAQVSEAEPLVPSLFRCSSYYPHLLYCPQLHGLHLVQRLGDLCKVSKHSKFLM